MVYNLMNESDGLFNAESFSQNPFVLPSGAGSSIALPANLESLSPQEKAQVYNSLVAQGFTEAEIRDTVESVLGPQTNGDWGALKDLASVVKATGTAGQGGAFTSNFGDPNSWQFGSGAQYNEKNMIESPGAYFQRGNDVIVSDELFWNPDSPTGQALAKKIDDVKSEDQRAGVVITPYAVFQGKATTQQLLDEVKKSGADFVAIDPYVGFGVPPDQLLAWTKEFVPQLNNLGVGVKLVLQDFARPGEEAQTSAYNQKLLETPGISEFISFGLEDAKDLQNSPDWTSMTGGQQFQTPYTQQAQAQPQQATATATQPVVSAQTAQPATNELASGIQQAVDFLNSPENRAMAEAAQTRAQINVGGKTYIVYPDGFAQLFEGGNVSVFDAGGNQVLQQTLEEYKKPGYLSPLVNAAKAALIGTVLGPAGSGLLGGTSAAAAGAGLGNLASGGNLESALKAAALGGAAAYGTESLLAGLDAASYNKAFAAADAAQLANQGLDAAAIAQNLSTYVDPATATTLANAAANQAFALADANQLVKQGLNTAQVTQVLQASGVSPSVAASVAEAAADGVTQISPTELVSNLKFQPQTGQSGQLPRLPDTVEITGQKVTGLPFDLSGISGGLMSSAALPALPTAGVPTQQVSVTAQPQQTTGQNLSADMASSVLSGILGKPVTVTGATQQVQVTGQPTTPSIAPEVAAALISAAVGQQVVVSGSSMPSGGTPATTGAATGGLLSAATQTVPVTGTNIPTTGGTPTATGSALGSLLPTQTVPVTGTTTPTTGGTATTAGAALGSLLATQTVPVTGTSLPKTPGTATTTGSTLGSLVPTQTVPVTSTTLPGTTTTPTTVGSTVGSLVPTQTVPVTGTNLPKTPGTPTTVGSVAGSLLPTTPPATTTTTAGTNGVFNPSDILKLIGLLGGLTAAGGGSAEGGTGAGTGTIPTSDTKIGSTTPQFGDDYYTAIQRYYNSYMPQYPRDVAGPLRQWYENKYGA